MAGTATTIGTTIGGVAIDPSHPFGYVSLSGADSVAVIETATGSLVGRVLVGDNPVGVAIGPDATRAFVINNNDGTLDAILTSDRTTVEHLGSVGSKPVGLVARRDQVWVANNLAAGTVTMYKRDGSGTLTVSVGQSPENIAASPDGRYLYVTNCTDNTVMRIDTALAVVSLPSVVDTIAVGACPSGVAVTPDYAFVPNYEGHSVSRINTTTKVVNDLDLGVGATPIGVSVNAAGDRVYVADFAGARVFVINPATNSLLATVTGLGINPILVATFSMP